MPYGILNKSNLFLNYYLRAFHQQFASALAGLLFSKGLNYIKEVPTQLLSQIGNIVTEASKQIPASGPTSKLASKSPEEPVPATLPVS